MKNNYLILLMFITTHLYGQEDSLFSKEPQNIPDITVYGVGNVIYENPGIYLLDFHIDECGKYLLLKGKSNYFISKLDDNMEMKSNFLLSFKPEALYRDCMGNLQIVSKDSVYKVDEKSIEIGIFEPNSMDFFEKYYANCLGQTNEHLIYRFASNSNQVITIKAIDKKEHTQFDFYTMQDSIQVLVANDWEKQIIADRYDFANQMGEINISQVLDNRQKFQRLMFYNWVVSKMDYNPLFNVDGEIYVFDHYKDSLLRFEATDLTKKSSTPISYHKLPSWQKELLYDEATKSFYATFLNNGNLYVSELSQTDFSIIKSVKVTKNTLCKRMMVYDGYLYYDFKDSNDDTFNKLYRQRI